MYGSSLWNHLLALFSISCRFRCSIVTYDFKQNAYPASTGCHRSVASDKPYQNKPFALKTAVLKSFCICPFKLSSNKTIFDKSESFFNSINVNSVYTIPCTSVGQVMYWENRWISRYQACISSPQTHFPGPRNITARLWCLPSDLTITWRVHCIIIVEKHCYYILLKVPTLSKTSETWCICFFYSQDFFSKL